jgi:hypothetical protein
MTFCSWQERRGVFERFCGNKLHLENFQRESCPTYIIPPRMPLSLMPTNSHFMTTDFISATYSVT